MGSGGAVSEKDQKRECWCGMDHAYMDIDADGNLFDVRDDPEYPYDKEQEER